ncbi:ribosome biogenesis GTP-binding protein YihA/YsxC [Ligilactobacillus saerimneri]|uniref:Probable GTP-binding protein EngB n=2 Tax=Ligilactobacillus saerimneri TaxID=228229 RepID=M5J4R2_9LACO|nr:ribosome biogenesis GTP-binding protein YihA/YsxC [Ligilactobacillus saerimneri]EKW98711.1 GTP-binding protein engB [Ligilactobacillus saerimneri 30a]KRL74907.1 GTPase [Ligilactobacillus saerimneri DSM 16049]MBU5308935.1 ribosome biogenesis GTP-binding protein YihA/YsxC [Ligilactobacillus saerimneri]MCZ0891565.1 ribosome biogenesis GTP-binding protein YihA/YsxC [Ligilactobacillus saerimneri]MDY4004013.1 ribosome biogenesis GTP-binding protein YihA/YsxC [Ligilactobacillus saerimneri]
MQVNNVNLRISAVRPDQYPKDGFPEVAFAGRSNVGKSSLTNVLINRRNYARTSSQPGKTQTLNFYDIESKLFFVDVPGYGYAKVSQKEREKWARMIETYFSERQPLRGVVTLVDARHEPTKLDKQMVDFLHYYDLPLLVVGTKVDKVPKSRRNRCVSQIRKGLALRQADQVVLFSAVDKTGKDDVWAWIEKQTGVK